MRAFHKDSTRSRRFEIYRLDAIRTHVDCFFDRFQLEAAHERVAVSAHSFFAAVLVYSQCLFPASARGRYVRRILHREDSAADNNVRRKYFHQETGIRRAPAYRL